MAAAPNPVETAAPGYLGPDLSRYLLVMIPPAAAVGPARPVPTPIDPLARVQAPLRPRRALARP